MNYTDKNSLIYKATIEMKNNPHIDSWYTRVEKLKKLLRIRPLYGKPEKAGFNIDKILKSKFDRFFLEEINEIKIGQDGLNHNKLRLYSTFKGCFKQENYISNINNRNQRCWLSRYRTSAHSLRVETGRYTSPVTPLSQRLCVYCDSGECDTEQHAILFCKTFMLKRQCFVGRVTALCPAFLSLTAEQQLSTLLCPTTSALAKCVSKFLGIISETRKEIDLGFHPQALQVYQKHKIQLNTD